MKSAGYMHKSGLALPTPEEAVELELAMEGPYLGELPLLRIGSQAMLKNPGISKIVQHDYRVAVRDEVAGISWAEKRGYKTGLRTGYQFFAGYITLLGCLRSEHVGVDDYLEDLRRDKVNSPAKTRAQRNRVESYREGYSPIDVVYVNEYEVESSEEMAHEDLGDYMFESLAFSALVNRVEVLLRGEGYPEEGSVIEGFYDGCENALEMYIQSREQAILSRLDFDASG